MIIVRISPWILPSVSSVLVAHEAAAYAARLFSISHRSGPGLHRSRVTTVCFALSEGNATFEVLERTITVRVREQTFRVFAVRKLILSWKDPTPARFDEILAFRHAETMQHASMLRSAAMIMVAKVDALMVLCDRLEASLVHAAASRRRLLDALLAEALAPVEARECEAAE